MHSEESFWDLIKEIQALGYDRETAGRYAVLIGDIPIRDDQGRIVVRDGDRVLARLELKLFDD